MYPEMFTASPYWVIKSPDFRVCGIAASLEEVHGNKHDALLELIHGSAEKSGLLAYFVRRLDIIRGGRVILSSARMHYSTKRVWNMVYYDFEPLQYTKDEV